MIVWFEKIVIGKMSREMRPILRVLSVEKFDKFPSKFKVS